MTYIEPPTIAVAIALVLFPIMFVIAADDGSEVTPHTEIFRLPIPAELPDHPRVFCTAEELEQVRADVKKGDPYTVAVTRSLVRRARTFLNQPVRGSETPGRNDFRQAATLAEAYAVSGNDKFGTAARDKLLWFADVCRELETTRSRGKFTRCTLTEGPVAVDAAMAYDLIASAPFTSEADRRHIEDDLLKVLAWECGHKCHHTDSSNWRSWALTIIASCGFASGDRELIEEAINGTWDAERNHYLYGLVQQITHSIFSDGIHWECSMGYTMYTASALMYVLEAAKNSGIDVWHAEMPGILGPFKGSANHEEYGPAGNRSIKAMLDAPFYYAFPNGDFARVNDSGARHLKYHRIYDLAWEEYGDPKYAWLINRHRESEAEGPARWSVWKPRGEPHAELTDRAHSGGTAIRLKTGKNGRVALVQDVYVRADKSVTVTGFVKALSMDGGSAHIRCNFKGEHVYTNRVRNAGDWQEVKAVIDPETDAAKGDRRRIRLHVFLEGGAGEVIFDDIAVTAGDRNRNLALNPGFEFENSDGRSASFWSPVNSPGNVPEGDYDLAEDATIGLTGRHKNGSTLFGIGGFAILRGNAADPQSIAVNFSFGPYGSGHDHPDRLQIVVYGRDRILCPDAGSWGYGNPMHLTWANQTIAHNTLTVDETSQYPQGNSDSIWASERGNRRVCGVKRLFHSGDELKAVRATCDSAYKGVQMDRTLCLVDNYLLDVFRVQTEKEHTYDLALHGPGQFSTKMPLKPVADDILDARGYEHLAEPKIGRPQGELFRGVFSHNNDSLLMLQAAVEGGRVIVAGDPEKLFPTTSCISRRKAANTVYVTLLEPFGDAPKVADMEVERRADAMLVTVKTQAGRDRLLLPADVDGDVELRRSDDGRASQGGNDEMP